MNYHADNLVKSCRKLESGIRLGQEGIHACQIGPFCSPLFWSGDEVSQMKITKDMIAEKRRWLFNMLNDNHSDLACKHCHMVSVKRYGDVDFTKLGHIDLAATTICNLRCSFCGYAVHNLFSEAKYNALDILKEFSADDVEWDSAVDFNGGEPTLLSDLDEYIEYFVSRRIRLFFYTNAVKFSPTVYDRLIDGSIRWICTSLDSGSPSTFLHIKKRDHFLQVLENLSRYAYAGSLGGGRLSVKYIFCDDNCGDDDISGFTYAMLAIRPQQIWLTFDFNPLNNLPGDAKKFGACDYTKHITAYVKMYRLMKKHGLTPGHFTENHLATASQLGKNLMERVLSEINQCDKNDDHKHKSMILNNFRKDKHSSNILPALFSTNPLQVKMVNQEPQPWSLRAKRIMFAPACALTTSLSKDPDIRESQILGFLDRDPVLQGKTIEGSEIYGYESIPDLNPEMILVATSELHQDEIVGQILYFNQDITKIALFK